MAQRPETATTPERGETAAGVVRVMLVDDHPIVREGLRQLLSAQSDMRVIAEAADGASACQIAKQLQPDVVVMDLSMPNMTGTEATARLRRDSPATRVLALTVHEERLYLTQLLRAGASGYVLKRSAPADLVRAVRIVAGGGTYIDPAVAGAVVEGYLDPRATAEDATHERLSDREREVLVRVSLGFSNKEIAAEIGVSVKTVETYKARAADKLGLKTRVDIVRYAARQGWLGDRRDS